MEHVKEQERKQGTLRGWITLRVAEPVEVAQSFRLRVSLAQSQHLTRSAKWRREGIACCVSQR